jgi:hypothetical protein
LKSETEDSVLIHGPAVALSAAALDRDMPSIAERGDAFRNSSLPHMRNGRNTLNARIGNTFDVGVSSYREKNSNIERSEGCIVLNRKREPDEARGSIHFARPSILAARFINSRAASESPASIARRAI